MKETVIQQRFVNLMFDHPSSFDRICQATGIIDREELKDKLVHRLDMYLSAGLYLKATVTKECIDWVGHSQYQYFVLNHNDHVRLMNGADLGRARAALRSTVD